MTVTSQRRTWRLQVHCPRGQDYSLEAFRELVRSSDGTVISQDPNAGIIRRTLSGAALDQVTLQSGKTINVTEMAEALAALVDFWEAEDLSE